MSIQFARVEKRPYRFVPFNYDDKQVYVRTIRSLNNNKVRNRLFESYTQTSKNFSNVDEKSLGTCESNYLNFSVANLTFIVCHKLGLRIPNFLSVHIIDISNKNLQAFFDIRYFFIRKLDKTNIHNRIHTRAVFRKCNYPATLTIPRSCCVSIPIMQSRTSFRTTIN